MHIREESRKKVDHPYYVFGDLMEIPKYGDFLIKKSSKSGDFGNFFFFFPPHKNPLYELHWIYLFWIFGVTNL
jgi:hypothetical protein